MYNSAGNRGVPYHALIDVRRDARWDVRGTEIREVTIPPLRVRWHRSSPLTLAFVNGDERNGDYETSGDHRANCNDCTLRWHFRWIATISVRSDLLLSAAGQACLAGKNIPRRAYWVHII